MARQKTHNAKANSGLAQEKNKILSLRAKGKLDEAVAAVKTALKRYSGSHDLRFILAKLYAENNQTQQAILEFRALIESDPENTSAMVELGGIYLKSGANAQAMSVLTSAYEKAPENAAAIASYASALHRHGHLNDAIALYRTALRLQAGKPTLDNQIELHDDFNKPAVEKLMWQTLEILASHGVHAFAFYGTLLGAVREGGLLPFDKDLDFGMPYSEFKRADKIMRKNGWKKVPQAVVPYFNPVSYYHEEGKVSVDFFGMTVEEESGITISGLWMPGVPKEWNQISEYPTIELVKRQSPEGGQIWDLKEPEEMLEVIYGPEWKVPDGYFDTVVAAKNLRGFDLVTQSLALPRIYSNIEKGNIKKAAAILASTLAGMPGDEVLLEAKKNLLVHDDAKHFLEGA